MLLYPERGLALNPTAATILQLCTGELTVEGIVERLQRQYADRPALELRPEERAHLAAPEEAKLAVPEGRKDVEAEAVAVVRHRPGL